MSAGPEIDRPEPLRQLTAAFGEYERALNANDVAVLDRLFWRSPLTLRYGVGECLYGHDAIAAFRAARATMAERSLDRTVITTFGDDFGTANTEFRRPGSDRIGRQSQSWVRFAEGWRIVAAHVSLMAPAA